MEEDILCVEGAAVCRRAYVMGPLHDHGGDEDRRLRDPDDERCSAGRRYGGSRTNRPCARSGPRAPRRRVRGGGRRGRMTQWTRVPSFSPLSTVRSAAPARRGIRTSPEVPRNHTTPPWPTWSRNFWNSENGSLAAPRTPRIWLPRTASWGTSTSPTSFSSSP